ncbi:MAG: alpha/beta hydrolase, partial [Marinicaulis sp.]|nr:alpha/beta hydrolase [Marinicaulis sp.]
MRVIFYGVLLILFALTGLAGCATWNAEKATPMLGARIDVDGQKIHVLDLGPRDSQKPPIVLIHGASVNLRDMKMALGDTLSADRRVILIDRPGRGYSDRPSDGWRLDSQAALIHGVVETLGVENPVIVGQSLGGAVALSYALQYQDEMSGLVLLAAVSHEWPGGVAWYNSVSNIPAIGFMLRRFVIPAYGQLVADSGIEESFEPDTVPENYAKDIGLALLFRPKDFRSNAA